MRFMAMAAILFLAACVTTVEDPPRPGAVKALIEADTAAWTKLAEERGVEPPTGVVRFVHPPVIYHEGELSAEDSVALAEAIGILNTVLPPSHRIRMGRQDDLKLKDALSQGEIVIGFMPRKEWPETVRNQFSALSTIRAFGFPFQPAGEPLERIVGGVIFVDSDHIKQRGNSVVDTLLHEFLHVFGRLHPKQGTFPHTIMNHGAPVRPPPYLYPLDIAALKMVYGESR